MRTKLRMVVSGGGTGGHFFPAKAIIDLLQKQNIEVKYIGSTFGVEADFFFNNCDDALLLNIRGIQRQLNFDSILKNLLFPFRFIISYYRSKKFLKKFKPHVVIGTGGYSSGLPLLAAIHLGLKTVIQEQNSFPGVTTRYLEKHVNKICTGYRDFSNYMQKKNLFLQETRFVKILNQ